MGFLSHSPFCISPDAQGSKAKYEYGNAKWKDQLTKYNGKAITYDAIGNPLSYNGWTYEWQAGRQLKKMAKSGTTAEYAYDHNGLRVRKVVNGVATEYMLHGKLVTGVKKGNEVLKITYDAESRPAMVKYNGAWYGYVHNLQGDIVGILDNTGAEVVKYTYDAWGKVISVSGSKAGTLGKANPFRYRGYVYDEETQLYYLRSRYYDPEVGRWINADSVIAGVGGSIQGYNMFAYCFNNPVNMSDSSGHWPQWMKNAANWVNNNIIQPVANFFSPSTNTISGQFQDGIFRGSGSLTGGYSEINGRLQVNSKDSKNNGMLGGFAKVSAGNASGKIGIGNDDVALSLKGVGDGLTATAQAGVQYKNGAGLAVKAKAAVLTGRATTELELFGWQIEFGVSGDLLSVGAEAMIGVFPDEGFIAKANVGAGLFGAGFVFRIKPAQ